MYSKVVESRCSDLKKPCKGVVAKNFGENFENETKMEIEANDYEEKPTINKNQGKRRLAFLDLLMAMGEQNQLTQQDIKEEVNTFMFEVTEECGFD